MSRSVSALRPVPYPCLGAQARDFPDEQISLGLGSCSCHDEAYSQLLSSVPALALGICILFLYLVARNFHTVILCHTEACRNVSMRPAPRQIDIGSLACSAKGAAQYRLLPSSSVGSRF